MGEAFITRRGGGPGKPPASYNFLQLITANLTYTVPETGWYKVHCIGKSGNGGTGGSSIYAYNTQQGGRVGRGGAGGNSGGVSISELFLKRGEHIACTVDPSLSSFGSLLSATAGGNGGNGGDGQFGDIGVASPTAGNGVGGTLFNAPGMFGGNGGTVATVGRPAGANSGGAAGNIANKYGGQNHGGGGGGAGNDLQMDSKYYLPINKAGGNGGSYGPTAGWSAPMSIPVPPRFSGSGGGGGGAGINTNGTGENVTAGAPGGLGSPGGIIIEKGVA